MVFNIAITLTVALGNAAVAGKNDGEEESSGNGLGVPVQLIGTVKTIGENNELLSRGKFRFSIDESGRFRYEYLSDLRILVVGDLNRCKANASYWGSERREDATRAMMGLFRGGTEGTSRMLFDFFLGESVVSNFEENFKEMLSLAELTTSEAPANLKSDKKIVSRSLNEEGYHVELSIENAKLKLRVKQELTYSRTRSYRLYEADVSTLSNIDDSLFRIK